MSWVSSLLDQLAGLAHLLQQLAHAALGAGANFRLALPAPAADAEDSSSGGV
jgi:hypothetical protein